MGLFSSKKKTYVSTQIQRVVADNQIPDLRQRNLVDSVFKNERLTKTIVNNSLKSHALKVERAYRYARRGDYVYGSPNHSILGAADGKQAVKNLVEAEEGTRINYEYFFFAPLNNLHRGWQILSEQYGYDEFRNTVTGVPGQNGRTLWVKNMVGHINTQAMTADDGSGELAPDDGTLVNWDRHPQDRYIPDRGTAPKTSVWLLDEGAVDGAEVTLVDKAGVEETLFLDMQEFDEDYECFQAKYYYYHRKKRKVGYFTYQYQSGAYPVLDALYEDSHVTNGTFLPVVLFRHNDTNRTATSLHETKEYKSTKQLMDLMGLDFQQLGDTIHENPDVEDLDQAALMFGVPASTEDDVEKEYLFKFFNWLYIQSPNTSRKGSYGRLTSYMPAQAIRIRDADFDCTLSFAQLRRRRVAGSVGEKGSYHQEVIKETRSRTVRRWVPSGQGESSYKDVTEYYDVELMRYRHQVTASHYDEIEVDGLQLRYNIYGSKGVTANVGSDKLLIPIDYTIARSMRFDRKERLYYRAMHFVLNARVTVTVKWYERGIFQVVLFVAAVVITIFSGGTQAWTIAVAAGTQAVVMLVLHAILTVLISQFVISKAFEVVIEELGYEIGIVLAVVAFVAAGYAQFNDLDWAGMAIQAGNNLVNASMVDIQAEVAEYRSEMQEFQLLAEEKMEELEEVDNLLNQYELLDPRSFLGKIPIINPGESPSDLYDRTVHSGNPGILQYDYIDSYVQMNTRLPTFDDLVGDTLYGRI